MILLIDNYDSFTYNLYQYIGSFNEEIEVIRNDKFDLDDIDVNNYTHVVISPGPGRPKQAGHTMDIIKLFEGKKPILGVCLGHQAIGECFGGYITYAKDLYHGKSDTISITNPCEILQGLNNSFKAARYHSLVIDNSSVPSCLEVTAKSSDGEIMAIKHKEFPIYGVQFHPESIATDDGMIIIENFINI